MRTAIDTNILSAIWDPEPNANELATTLSQARQQGSLVICGAVFAETMANPGADEEFVRLFLNRTGIDVDFSFNEPIWRLAGLRYAKYVERRRKSPREFVRRLLADYIIGAHALLAADRLMTLDRARYQRDFPELKLI
jgi:predicted nucleic acid-binding protein